MPTPQRWSRWLKQLRTDHDQTQEQLAEEVGCAVDSIRAFETGRRRPSRAMAERLAEVLLVDPTEQQAFVDEARAAPSLAELPPPAAPPSAPPASASVPQSIAPAPLPLPPTPMIGREEEQAELNQRLRASNTRLVTLIGPGGVGKTRLALQLAHDLRPHFGDGAAFVSLAPIAVPAYVADAVADALLVPVMPGQTADDAVLHWLRERELLLVVDNLEHLLPATSFLVAILAAAPGVRILATSRERLRLQAEWVVELGGLPVPNPDGERVARSPAVMLFAERASRAGGTFALGPHNEMAVVAICRHLEGLPLALELAAARIKHLGVHALAERLDHALGVLRVGAVDLPERHRTLRATLQWSYDLLPSAEQTLFRWLAVFRGGWTLAAAEAVGEGLGEEVIDLLANLVDKSLVVADTLTTTGRYRLLEPVRQYAEELLLATGEHAAIQARRAAWMLVWAAEAERHLGGAGQAAWFGHTDQELPNLRAALHWLVEQHNSDQALQLCTALYYYWLMRGSLAEGQSWLDRALALPPASLVRRGWALHLAALIASYLGDVPALTTRLDEGLAVFRALGDERGTARMLFGQGYRLYQQGRSAEARQLAAQALALLRQEQDREGVGWTLRLMGMLAMSEGAFDEATAWFEQSHTLWRQLGNQAILATTLVEFGQVAMRQGNYELAEQRFREGRDLFQALGVDRFLAFAETVRGWVALHRNAPHDALRFLQAQIPLLVAWGNGRYLGLALLGLAVLAAEHEQPARAARLLAATEHLLQQAGRQLDPYEHTLWDRALVARTLLTGEAWAAGWRDGERLTLQDMEREALAVTLSS